MSIDAMKQALEALQHCLHYAQTHLQHFDAAYNRHPSAENERGVITDDIEDAFAALTALRAAIEQAQEPVAWMYVNTDGECEQIEYETPPDDPSITPLYTAPRQWQGLTEDEREQFRRWAHPDMIEAIELRLQERNT